MDSALRRAFSEAASSGSPSSSSSVSGTRTEKRTPSCWRIARRCGERDARISDARSSELREEQLHFAGGRLRRVRAVHHVLAYIDRVVAADRAGGGLKRVGGADHLTGGLDRTLPLQHHRHEWS